MEQLDEVSQAVCASFFDRLVTPTGSKVACSRDDLERWADSLAPKVPEVLESLSDNRILRTVVQSAENLNATSYEIYHDVLAPAVLAWRARYIDERQRAELERKANEAEARAKEKEKTNRRLIRLSRYLWIAFIIALIFAGYAFFQKNKAISQQKRAIFQMNRAMTFAAVGSSYNTLDKDPSLSTLLALQGVSLAQSKVVEALPRAETTLLRVLSNRMKWSQDLKASIHAVAFSPDGGLLATASGKRIRLWDAQTGEETTPNKKLMEHVEKIQEIVFAGDGNRLVAGDDGGNIRLWDIRKGDEILTSLPMQHDNKISAMAVGPANLLATGDLKKGRVIFWNLDTGERKGLLPLGEGKGVKALAFTFTADVSRLAVGEVNRGTTTVWDVSKLLSIESAVPAYELDNWQDKEGTSEPDAKMLIDSVAFSPDGQLLATGDRFNTANLWNAKTGAHLATLWGHTDQILKIAFSPLDGNRLATASVDGTVKIWDTKTRRLLLTLLGHRLQISDLAFSPDGNWLATVSLDKQAKLWNIAMHSDALLSAAFSPDGRFLATGSGDKTIKIWASGTRELVATLVGHKGRIQKLAFSPPGGKFLASASFDKTARIWDWQAGNLVAKLQYKDAGQVFDKIYDIAYSADGQWLATAGANHNAAVWDATGSFKFTGRHGGEVKAVAFSPDDGKYFASVGSEGRYLFSF